MVVCETKGQTERLGVRGHGLRIGAGIIGEREHETYKPPLMLSLRGSKIMPETEGSR